MNEQCVDEYVQLVKEIYNRDVEFVSPREIVNSKTKQLPDKVMFLLYKEDVKELNRFLKHNLPYTPCPGGSHWNNPNSFPILMHSDFDPFDNEVLEVLTGWMNFSPTDEFKEGETDIGRKSVQWYYDKGYRFDHFYVFENHAIPKLNLDELI